ncbi:Transcription factor atf21 [Madurella fahalii]|uniref:Transcription factor atf21 n=1 Tax=Madurella fahalii TaxID=1157608 RepID=A0ABQ0FYM1_9PEZI
MAITGRWHASVQVDVLTKGGPYDHCERTRAPEEMGSRATGCSTSTFERQKARIDVDSFASMLDAQRPRPHDATAPLPNWGANGTQESLLSFDQTATSMDWQEQISATGPGHLRRIAPTHSDFAGEQSFQSSTEWLQLPSSGYASTVIDDFETGLSGPSSMPWPPGALVSGITEQPIVGGSILHSESISSYPLAPLELESKLRALSVTPRPSDDAIRPQQCQDRPAGEYDLEYNRERRELPHGDAADVGMPAKRKRGRPPNQTRDIDLMMHARPPTPRRESTADTTTSSDVTAVADVDSFLLSIMDDAAPDPHDVLPKKTTAATTLTTTHARRGYAGSTSNNNNNNTNNKNKNNNNNRKSERNRDRNRAAASRYRAKTQAAFAQLEAEEREASERHRSLLACAGRLRDEVFQLKNELLRHADCDCPFIQAYLSQAARQASAGLRASVSSMPTGLTAQGVQDGRD